MSQLQQDTELTADRQHTAMGRQL